MAKIVLDVVASRCAGWQTSLHDHMLTFKTQTLDYPDGNRMVQGVVFHGDRLGSIVLTIGEWSMTYSYKYLNNACPAVTCKLVWTSGDLLSKNVCPQQLEHLITSHDLLRYKRPGGVPTSVWAMFCTMHPYLVQLASNVPLVA